MTTYYPYRDTVQDTEGRPVPGATVTVSKYPSGTTTIYSDAAGTSPVNGVMTDTNGYYELFAEAGRYTVLIVATGIGTLTREPVDIGSPVQTDWTAPTSYGTNWGAFSAGTYGDVGFLVDGNGIVHLRGAIHLSTGTATDGDTVLTLPAAARPGFFTSTWVHGGITINARLHFFSNGDVTLHFNGGTPDTLFLNGISYPAATVTT